MMMKGPACVADAYPQQEAETLEEVPKWHPHGRSPRAAGRIGRPDCVPE
jgi:hypothetical protein